jgi:hypothetical protein
MMNIRSSIVVIAFAASCGGSKPPSPPPVVEQAPEPEPEPEPEPPPPPQVFQARASLTPVKGIKLAPPIVTFVQTEGEDTKVATEIEGLKANTYHLVVHEGNECGPNATKAGPVWDAASEAKLSFKVLKGAIGELDKSVTLPLDGDTSVIGRALVLHEDKKGQPGKAVACGVIEASDGAADGDAGGDE